MLPVAAENPPRVNLRFPWLTMLVAFPAIGIVLFPGASAWLVYDRAAILGGEAWRLFTCHWVHFSTSHLAYDLLAFGLAGWMIESQRLPHFGWLCVVAAGIASVAVLVFEPQMRWFGGLSALAVTAIVYLALSGLERPGPWRWVCLVALLGVAGKIIFEAATGRMLFVASEDATVVVSSASHLAGAAVALIFYGRVKWFPGRR